MIRRYESGIKLRKLSSVLCDDLEGWDWGEMGGRSQGEGIYVYM